MFSLDKEPVDLSRPRAIVNSLGDFLHKRRRDFSHRHYIIAPTMDAD
jgi:hypothetical protein